MNQLPKDEIPYIKHKMDIDEKAILFSVFCFLIVLGLYIAEINDYWLYLWGDIGILACLWSIYRKKDTPEIKRKNLEKIVSINRHKQELAKMQQLQFLRVVILVTLASIVIVWPKEVNEFILLFLIYTSFIMVPWISVISKIFGKLYYTGVTIIYIVLKKLKL